MNLEERVISKEVVFEGEKIKVVVENVILPNGVTARREFVNRRSGAAILALNEDQQVVLMEEYRHPFEKTILTLPYGKQKGEETLLQTAQRELKEKTGYSAAGRI